MLVHSLVYCLSPSDDFVFPPVLSPLELLYRLTLHVVGTDSLAVVRSCLDITSMELSLYLTLLLESRYQAS